MSPVLRERLRRVRIVRRRVVAISLAIFVLAWAVIFFQMVAGRDPGLAKRTTTVAATSTQHKSPKKKHASSTSSSSSSESSSSSSGSSSTPAASPSPVTTSQS